MSRVVIIENGVVTNAIIADLAWAQQHYPNADVREHPHAGPGWILVDEELQAPPNGWVPEEPPTLSAVQAKLREQATALRWAHETGGITVNGVRVATGIEDQNRIATVLAAAQVAELTSVDFKAESGWVTLSLAELQGIAAAITAHVQACFSAERAHHEAIDALESVADALAYNVHEGWPRTLPDEKEPEP